MKPVSPEYPAPPKKKAGQVHSVDKPTIEDYLTPNAEFETRGRPVRRKRLSPPDK